MCRQHLLSRLAGRGWPVVYSNGPLSVWNRNSTRWQAASWSSDFEHRDGVAVDRPGKWLPRWPRVAAVDDWAYRHHTTRLLQQAGIDHERRGIQFLFHPAYTPYLDRLRLRYTVYHAFDDFSLTPGWTELKEREERHLVATADLVLAVSEGIAERLRSYSSREVLLLPNGADTEAFARATELECPADLAAIPRPRIGYIGRINPKVDLAKLAQLAQRHPSWSWVFVGPTNSIERDAYTREGFEACTRLPNVHFLGGKPQNTLPAYMGHMDVNAMCYRTSGDGWWQHIYPLKLHEYLAVGLPVVSSGLASIRPFAEVVAIADSADEWSAAVETALTSGGVGTPELRQRTARQNSWERRVDQLEEYLQTLIEPSGTTQSVVGDGCS